MNYLRVGYPTNSRMATIPKLIINYLSPSQTKSKVDSMQQPSQSIKNELVALVILPQ